ncbi:MAG: hypothetical protein E7403_03150 [Ruminococcaceae bacterium]|nr:hypothetical protein [Oscillospiraceae bacterium]
MANDTMPYMQEEREPNYTQGTSPETGGRSIPGYFYSPPNSNNGGQPNPAPEENPMNVGNPQTTEEAYLGSFQAALQNNLGYFVVIEFLIGTNGLTEKEGILYAVGNNFVTLYEQETDRYIVCDLFSIKFVTFFRQTPSSNRGNRLGYESSPANQNSYGGMVPRRY